MIAKLSHAFANEAKVAEWKLKVDVEITPDMSPAERKAAVRAAAQNKTVRRLAMFWTAVAALLADDGPELSGWLGLTFLDTKEGPVKAVVLKGRTNIHDDWHAPTLILDACADVRLLQPYWPTVELTADIPIETPHMRVLQVADKTYAKGNYTTRRQVDLDRDDITKDAPDETNKPEAKRLRDLNATIGAIARAFAPGRTLAVTQLDIREALPTVGRLPYTVDLGHHNAIAGLDGYRDHTALICVGRTAAAPAAVERAAEALTGRAVTPLEGWYPKAATAREMADGSTVAAEADEHPDPIANAIRWQVCEGELIQIIGRMRGCNRSADNPATVILMTSTPLPLPITGLLSADDLRPDPMDLQLSQGGVAFTNPTHASRVRRCHHV